MRLYILTIIFTCYSVACLSQGRNNIWCFGDSAGIRFSNGTAIPIESSIDSRGSCVSISNSNDSILFYANTRAGLAGNTTLVWNKGGAIMSNGNNIVGSGWYLELVIVPFPNDTSKYYLFSAGVSSMLGLYYSIIDMTMDSGRGAVISKNLQLQTPKSVDCLTTIKHGNGRDWWLFYRRWDNSNNNFYTYLITDTAITLHSIQSTGTSSDNGFLSITFSPLGDKLIVLTYRGLIEKYDFDRCTGIISNPVLIESEASSFYPQYFDCEFSPDGNNLYVSSNEAISSLFQYNLLAPNPSLTRDTIYSITLPHYAGGALKLAPDNKIYWSCIWNDSIHFPYPYPDSAFYPENMNLSVINSPDSLGAACNFTPYSFYLGGNRTYWGLPNNPDYEMKPLYGSVCDSLSAGINEQEARGNGQLFVSYISDWQKAFINAQYLKGTTYTLSVIDITGRQVFKEKGRLRPPYFTKDLDCANFSSGMYIVTVTTDKERLNKKFVKN